EASAGAWVAEVWGTHRSLPQNDDTRRRGLWPRSEPASQQVDSLGSIRVGVRLSQSAGSRVTTFVHGLAGIEWGYRHSGFADNSGFSLAAGGGVDVGLTNWLALEA